MKLKFEDVPGYMLTQQAFYAGFTYVVYWGTSSNAWYVDIYDNEIPYQHREPIQRREVDGTRMYCNNFGKQRCIEYAQLHASKNSSIIGRIRRMFE